MKLSTILKKAKRLIANKRHVFICFAIDDVSGYNSHEKWVLRKWITGQLRGWGYYEIWLEEYHPEIARRMGKKQLCQGRIQWLDSMIQQLESSGK